jgi:hypothetical protein
MRTIAARVIQEQVEKGLDPTEEKERKKLNYRVATQL